MSDRPRARTRCTLEANLPESFFTASPSRESGLVPLGKIFREIKELPTDTPSVYLAAAKRDRAREGWCNGWLTRGGWKGESAEEGVE